VTDSLLYFVKNTEELAGTLCHEVSHTIHHDSMALIEKERKLERREIGAAILNPICQWRRSDAQIHRFVRRGIAAGARGQ